MFSLLKRLFFWSYGRSTWQYDVLCVLILAFIFLTPKAWFDNSELRYRQLHPNGSVAATKLLVMPEKFADTPDTQEIERRAQTLTGRSNTRVREVHPLKGEDGKVVAYEVDIE